MALGLITMFLIMHTTSVLRAVGNAFWPAWIMVGANALNVLLDVALVFGYWGFPRLGVAGAAWATVIARLAGAGLGLWLIWRGTGGVALRRIPFRRPFQFLRTMFVTGVPTSLQLSARVVAVFFLLRVARDAWPGSGSEMLDGVGICVRLEMVAVFMALGWGAAATTLVGQNLGAGLTGRAARGSWVLTLAGAISMAVVGFLVWTFREPLLRVIMPELTPDGFRAAEGYLTFTIPFYPAIAVGLVLARGLNGAGCTRTPLLIDAVSGFLVMLPLGAWLSGAGLFGVLEGRALDVRGVWWGMGIANSLAALAYVYVFHIGRWRTKASLVRPPLRGAAARARLTLPRAPE
jgi:Na+-driven multidrug efflux pump